MLDNCQLHSGRLNNVLGYNLTVTGTGSDGKHDTVTSQVRIDFRKFSEVAVEQMVILRLETTQPDQVANVLAGDDSVQLLSLSLGQNTTDLFLAVQESDRTYQARPLALQTLQSRLSEATAVTTQLGYTVCERDNPCQNGGLCSSKIVLSPGQSRVIAEIGGDVILNSPRFVEEVTCDCPDNFEGSECQLQQQQQQQQQ